MTYALLIDDDQGLLTSLTRVAKKAGHELLTASTWDEGLAQFQVYSPSVVIADYNLPGSRHGLQLLAEIRRLSPSVRLLILSAYIDGDDSSAIEATGLVDRALPKTAPNVIDEILAELGDARDRSGQGTDWVTYARASEAAAQVSKDEIDN